MSKIRQAAVAGLFYPDDADQLRSQIDQLMSAAAASGRPVKALIAPHAGYIYSGPVAARAYAEMAPLRGRIRRVVLLGPSHRVAFHGLAASSATAFATPLGNVPVDRAATDAVLALPQVRVLDAAHIQEHSLEVQLPFLQSVLDAFAVVPLVVGDASADDVAEVLETLWGGDETLIVISSDLSHYLDYASARALDAATARAIATLDPQAIDYDQACGRNPVKGLLVAARRHHLTGDILDLRNSGDTAGDRRRVVGYGAFAFG